jgi:DNA segregation ATPase FtsK/SpoIIIE-like protein
VAASKTKSGASRKKRAPKKSSGKSKSTKSQQGLSPEVKRGMAYLSALAICGFVLLSLGSYSSADSSFISSSASGDIANLCGPWGAAISSLLYQGFGFMAWAMVPFTGWVWLRFAGRPGGRSSRLISGGSFCWCFATLLSLLFFRDPTAAFPAGGFFGELTASLLLSYVGAVGAYIVAMLMVALSATFLFGIDWHSMAQLGVKGAEEVADISKRALSQTSVWAIEQAKNGRDGVAEWSNGREEKERRGGATSRYNQELDSPEPEFGGVEEIRIEPAVELDENHTIQEFDAEANLDAEIPTIAAVRDLVEVEYEPTNAEFADPNTWPDERVQGASISPTSGLEKDEPLSGGFVDVEGHLSEEPPVDFGNSPERSQARELPVVEEESRGSTPAVGSSTTSQALVKKGDLECGGDNSAGVVVERPSDPGYTYELPTLSLLDKHQKQVGTLDEDELRAQGHILEQKLADFGVKGEVTAIRPGPIITIFEYLPAPGIKVAKIANLTDDIAMAMKAIRVRIVAPIPGRGVVGVEIPNISRQTVWFRDLLVSKEFRNSDRQLPMALGKSVDGKPVIADLASMPHLLVGGTTGAGKSVSVNAMLMTLLYARTPEDLRMILIDPKMLEFELYRDIPHLLHPVVTNPKLAAAALKWACGEMERRYAILARWGTRSIHLYNKKMEREMQDWTPEKARKFAPREWPKSEPPPIPKKLPYIVVVIDELADLMMVARKEVEESIVRLAQKARAAGIHLVVATQRPSADVITGLIKANMPSRCSFQVRTKIDSRVILDQNGAETLLGKGDMLFLPPGVGALERVHGPFVSDDEVSSVTDFLREQGEPDYEAEIRVFDEEGVQAGEEEYDEVYDHAVQIVTEAGKASTSMIQRRLKIGYNRAARIVEMMEREGVVGPADGARPREVFAQAHP